MKKEMKKVASKKGTVLSEEAVQGAVQGSLGRLLSMHPAHLQGHSLAW